MLTLTLKDKPFIIDDEDLDLFLYHKWNITDYTWTNNYAICKIGSFHRVVLGITDTTQIVDHINGDTRDNRKSNLRIVTSRMNSQNTYLRREGLTASKYYGVHKHKSRWRARYWDSNQKKHISIGLYKTEEQAARAYDNYVKSNYTKSCHGKLNFDS